MQGKKKARTKVKAAAPKKARGSAKGTRVNSSLMLPEKAITQKHSKSQMYSEIAEIAQVSKSDAKNIMAALKNIIARHVKPKGFGEVTIHDLGIKVRRVHKKATKARMGRNPLTGEEIRIAAKPARKTVKVSALKNLKELIAE